MKTYVLYNKLAGNGTGEQRANRLRTLWGGKDLVYRDIEETGDYADFFAGLLPEDEVVLCGGDGTLNRFINDTDGLELRNDLYYYAVGSGNDFWHDLGLTLGDEPCRINEYIKDLPVVEVNGRTYRFLNAVGYGIDGYCCEVGDELREKSDKPINYAGIAVKGLLFHYKPTNAEIMVDRQSFTCKKVWLAPTMNGRFYGGGMMPTPEQDRLAESGAVSVMVMHGGGKLKTLMILPSIFKGEHVKRMDMVKVLSGRDITVSFDRPTALQIDDETIPNVSGYHVRARRPAQSTTDGANNAP